MRISCPILFSVEQQNHKLHSVHSEFTRSTSADSRLCHRFLFSDSLNPHFYPEKIDRRKCVHGAFNGCCASASNGCSHFSCKTVFRVKNAANTPRDASEMHADAEVHRRKWTVNSNALRKLPHFVFELQFAFTSSSFYRELLALYTMHGT